MLKEEHKKKLDDVGSITMKIHPEHLDAILEKSKETDRLQSDYNDSKRVSSIAKKKMEIAKEEMWILVHDSFDTEMKAIRDVCEGQEIDTENGTITFRNGKESLKEQLRDRGKKMMDAMGVPKEVRPVMMKQIEKAIQEHMDDD